MGLINNTPAEYYSQEDFGNYQFVTMDSIISAFMIAYVGEDKIIPKVNRTDVQFHAMRAIQELSYDVFSSFKSQEITVPNTLKLPLPQDYVNYVKLVRPDSNGIERVLYPTGKTSNPFRPQVNSKSEFNFDINQDLIPSDELLSNGNFSGSLDQWMPSWTFLASGAVAQQSPLLDAGGAMLQGWEYNENSARGHQITISHMIGQKNLPIIHGEKYKLTFTVEDYSVVTGSPSFQWYLSDQESWAYASDSFTGNGTYSKTFEAGSDGLSSWNFYSNNYEPGLLYLKNHAAAGSSAHLTIKNVSLTRIGFEGSETWDSYKDQTETDIYTNDAADVDLDFRGRRYGLDPQFTQANGTFFIDQQNGFIHFGSSLSGKTIILKYVSDGLGTDEEMVVHKFCEDAVYKWIAYGILSTRSNIPEFLVQRYRKERFAATRKAKIRLSNIKIEEFTQVLKGLGKVIK